MPTIQPNTGSYYFAQDSNPDPTVVTVPTLLANGAGNGVNQLGIVTVETKDPGWGGSGAFNINNKDDHNPRWNIGVNGEEDGTPAGGSDFAIWRYDNSGNGLGMALSISRSTGNVTINGNLTATSITAPNIGVITFPCANPIVPGTNIDLVSNNANNMLVIPVPLAAQNAKLFKLRITGGLEYLASSLIPVSLQMYCSSTSQALSAAAGDTEVTWGNVLNSQIFNFGTNSARIIDLPESQQAPIVYTNEMTLTVQNPTAAAVPNLYFIITPTPPDGTLAIGSVITNGPYNLSANVEAYY